SAMLPRQPNSTLFPYTTLFRSTMEYEHQKAEQHLRDFLDKADQAGKSIDEDDAQIITVNAVQAYATLTQHFAKEETKLFPLADTILSYEEKEELDRLFREN